MHVVPIISAPYTGKGFLAEFFKPLTTHCVLLEELRANRYLLEDEVSEAHGLQPNSLNLVVGEARKGNREVTAMLAQYWNVIVPLRDPLATLVSRQHRFPGQSHMPLLDQWKLLAQRIEGSEAFFFPVDLLSTACHEDRASALMDITRAAGLAGHHKASEHCAKWTNTWPRHNSKGMYGLKAAYLQGDLDTLERVVGPELEALRREMATLGPFLKAAGYKELLWWI